MEGAETFDSINPAKPAQVVGRFAKADERLAAKAIEAATEALPSYVPAPSARGSHVSIMWRCTTS